MGYEYGYDANVATSAATAGFGAIFGFFAFIWIIFLIFGIFTIVCNWKVYKKAGKQGWECLVPIYNFVVLLEIANLPLWYLILFIVPIGNIVVTFLIYIGLAKKFGKSTAFGLGLVFFNPIFMAILAFSKNCVYQGEVTNNNSANNEQPVTSEVEPVTVQQPIINEQPIQNNNCQSCGAPVNQGDKFCMNCGNKLF